MRDTMRMISKPHTEYNFHNKMQSNYLPKEVKEMYDKLVNATDFHEKSALLTWFVNESRQAL